MVDQEHPIAAAVRRAKEDGEAADRLIRDCLPFIGQMLRDGERRLMGLMERVPVQVISLVGTGFEGVHFNVNTPEDLARLRVLEKLDNSVGFC